MPNAASNLVTKVCQKVKYATEYMLGTVSTKIRKMADIWESKSCCGFKKKHVAEKLLLINMYKNQFLTGSCLFPSNNRILSTTTRKAKMNNSLMIVPSGYLGPDNWNMNKNVILLLKYTR